MHFCVDTYWVGPVWLLRAGKRTWVVWAGTRASRRTTRLTTSESSMLGSAQSNLIMYAGGELESHRFLPKDTPTCSQSLDRGTQSLQCKGSCSCLEDLGNLRLDQLPATSCSVPDQFRLTMTKRNTSRDSQHQDRVQRGTATQQSRQ